MRKIDEIINDISSYETSDEVSNLVKELNNTYGTRMSSIKDEIYGLATENSQIIDEDRYISLEKLYKIINTVF